MDMPFKASVQYGDFHGTVAADTHSGIYPGEFESLAILAEHAKIPKGYRPVGLKLYLGEQLDPKDKFFAYSIVAMKTDGRTLAEMKEKGEIIEVKTFRAEGLTHNDVLRLVKRLEICMLSRALDDVEVVEQRGL